MSGTKKCKVCEKTKPVELFYMYDKKKALYRRQCKECFRAMRKRGISHHRKHNLCPRCRLKERAPAPKTEHNIKNNKKYRAYCIDCEKITKREYDKSNPDKRREYSKKYRNSEKGRAKVQEYIKCGKKAKTQKLSYEKWKKKFNENKNSCMQRAKTYIIGNIRSRATVNKLPFNLTHEDIHIPDKCPVLDLNLTFYVDGFSERNNTISVDRLIPELGYVKGNIRMISMKANRLKSNASFEEIELLYNWMKKELGKK